MYQFILLIHVFTAIFIVTLVLVQQGKGATTGAAFGSGASQTVFGSRGSGSFLFRLTIACGAVFFITSIGLNYMATRAYKQQAIVNAPLSLPVRQQTAPALPSSAAPVVPTAPSGSINLPGKTPGDTMSVDLPVAPSQPSKQ